MRTGQAPTPNHNHITQPLRPKHAHPTDRNPNHAPDGRIKTQNNDLKSTINRGQKNLKTTRQTTNTARRKSNDITMPKLQDNNDTWNKRLKMNPHTHSRASKKTHPRNTDALVNTCNKKNKCYHDKIHTCHVYWVAANIHTCNRANLIAWN